MAVEERVKKIIVEQLGVEEDDVVPEAKLWKILELIPWIRWNW